MSGLPTGATSARGTSTRAASRDRGWLVRTGSGSGRRVRVRHRAAYTLIEVMMAVAVLMAGSVAIMAMHQAATRGNMEARQLTMGTQLAQRWVERLRRDSIHWTRSGLPTDATLLAGTTYLGSVAAPGTDATWFIPTPASAYPEATSFDYLGQDVVGTAPPRPAHYCTNLRLEWVYPGQVMRADVRVWWPRRGDSSLSGCAPGTDPNTLTDDQRVQMVYASTVLRFVRGPS